MKRTTRVRIALVLTLCLPLATARAAPVADDEQIQTIVDEIKGIASEARAKRSADPWVLRSLDDLIRRYEWPWRVELLREDFSDGDHRQDPAWQVTEGRFWVDASLGLRSRFAAQPATAPSAQPTQRRDEDLGRVLLGALLEGVAQSQQPRQQQQSSAATSSGPSEILLPLAVSNAFALQLEFSVHNAPAEAGRIEFGVYQGGRRDSGYRIAISTGPNPVLDLIRLRSGRRAIIDSVQLDAAIGDGQPHTLDWRRETSGEMSVRVNDEQTISTVDRAFREAFEGLQVVNGGGDYALRSISLYGTQ